MIKNAHLHKQIISELEILKNQTSQYQLNEFIITYEDQLFFYTILRAAMKKDVVYFLN